LICHVKIFIGSHQWLIKNCPVQSVGQKKPSKAKAFSRFKFFEEKLEPRTEKKHLSVERKMPKNLYNGQNGFWSTTLFGVFY